MEKRFKTVSPLCNGLYHEYGKVILSFLGTGYRRQKASRSEPPQMPSNPPERARPAREDNSGGLISAFPAEKGAFPRWLYATTWIQRSISVFLKERAEENEKRTVAEPPQMPSKAKIICVILIIFSPPLSGGNKDNIH